MHLPEKFQKEMEILLGDEYQAFKESYDRQPENGLRLNRRKVTGEEFLTRTPFLLKKIPWIDNGYTYGIGTPAKDPYYYAGLYYLQEPSAMTPANRLSPEPGDYVLDLCAAPGGKATELGAKLNGEGLLLANDISNSRAKALLKNLELMGIPNIYVTSETSEKLAKILPEFFDKILVDAPCSGTDTALNGVVAIRIGSGGSISIDNTGLHKCLNAGLISHSTVRAYFRASISKIKYA